MNVFFQQAAQIFQYVNNAYSKTSSDVMQAILTHYSPWTIADEETKRAQEGTAARITSSREIDLLPFVSSKQMKYWLPSLASLGRRTMHVVNDFELIKKELHHGRNNNRSEDYPIGLDTFILGSENMLLCPKENHSRLRAPFERAFCSNNIKETLAESIATDLLASTTFDTSMTQSVNTALDHSSAKGKLSEQEQLSSASLLHGAAHYTTMVSETYIYHLLNHHPDLATKILQEWEDIFGKIDGSYVTQDEAKKRAPLRFCTFINGGTYLDQFISPSALVHAVVLEALRLYPIVPQIVRVAKEDFQIEETSIQAGDVVILNIMGYQRDSQVWQDSDSFHPERWITSENQINTELSKKLLTFSHGPYACIGQHLALQNLLLATTLTALRIGHRERGASDIVV